MNREYVCLVVSHLDTSAGEMHVDHLPQEEVVRCRSCAKWHECDYDGETLYGTCEEFTRPGRVCCTRSNGFCAWGRRRYK